MVKIIIYDNSNIEITSVEFTDAEWDYIKKQLIESTIEYQISMVDCFEDDLQEINDLHYIYNNFLYEYPELIKKLQLLHINTHNIEKLIKQ